MGLQVRCKCGVEIVGRCFCADCLPPVAVLGRNGWQRRYRELVVDPSNVGQAAGSRVAGALWLRAAVWSSLVVVVDRGAQCLGSVLA